METGGQWGGLFESAYQYFIEAEWKVHSNPQWVRHHDHEFYYTYHVNMLLAIYAHTGKFVGFSSPSGIRFFAASGFNSLFYLILSTNGGCILFEPDGLTLNKKGGYFANEFIPYHIAFIAGDRFVMAGRKTAQLYEIRNGTSQLLNEVNSQNAIAGILATNHRNSFALVDEMGGITKYEIE